MALMMREMTTMTKQIPRNIKNGAAVGCPPIRPIYIPNRPNHFDRVFPNSGISLP